MDNSILPSWRPGHTRDTIETFLREAEAVPVEQRVAVFDNDGTLWGEKPLYTQLDFFLQELRLSAAQDPTLADRPEYGALLAGDKEALGAFGPVQLVMALAEIHDGITPEEFNTRVDAFFESARQPDRGVPYRGTRYQPMLELIDELRSRDFQVFLVSAGGAEFVRVISRSFYDVSPEGVVGSQVGYELVREDGKPKLVRNVELSADPNEGPAKIANIQRVLGQRPIVAGGNSAGDAEMLEYAAAGDGPTLALLVDHDDAEREYEYASVAGTFDSDETIVETAARQGWTVISMKNDWTTVFADA